MSAVAEEKKIVVGGSFLVEERTPEEVFTPEDFTEEHRMIADTARQFMDNEVRPRIDDLEKKDWKLARELVQKGAELGFIGATVPEEYGGLGLDQVAGALAAKATARLSEDGTHYVLKGEKMWITNGGFADVFVVFAKVDGEKFTGFVVERQEGLANGAEEHKMGIKGSSTTALALDGVKTPVENLLGEVGKGHKIAFNILNIGRFKLGAMCCGGMKLMASEAVRYANERHQFGKPISSFGAIKHKLAEMAIRTWVGEAMIYRTLGLIESAINATADAADPESKLRAIEEYAAECSAIKVTLSEYCDTCADEMVQIFGGYGYSADYPAERAYRDSRINRIFEGTNEINRMLIPGMLMKRALTGKLALLPAAQALMDEVLSPSLPSLDEDEGVLAAEAKLARNAKKVALMVLGTAAQKYMTALAEEQEVLIGASNIIMDVYAMESAILRAQKLAAAQGPEAASLCLDMVRIFCNDAVERVEVNAKNTLAAIGEGDELRTLLAALRRFTKHTPANTVAARRRVADAMIKANRYTY